MLGGRSEALRYRQMYEKAFAVFTHHLVFRPMIPDIIDVLACGNAHQNNIEVSAQHLACFAGGMVSQTAKIFDRPSDLAIGPRVFGGCISAYNATSNIEQ